MTPADLDAVETMLRVVYLAPGIADAFAALRKERDAMREVVAAADAYRKACPPIGDPDDERLVHEHDAAVAYDNARAALKDKP